MGCGASNASQPDPGSVNFHERQFTKARAAQEARSVGDAAAAYKLAGGEAAAKNAGQAQALTGAALQFGQQFEQTTPMLVMPFGVFKAQGRIMKSTQVWRDGALAAGSLVVH